MENKDKKRFIAKYQPIYLIPLVIILAILPLIVHIYSYDPKLSEFKWFSNQTEINDFFLYYKSVVFIIVCVLMIFMFAFKIFMQPESKKFTITFIPVIIYAVLSLLSSVLSNYSYFSYNGIYEQFESVWVLIGYCIAAYYAYYMINCEEDVKFVLRWWMVGIIVTCLLGISQVTKNDFFKTALGQKLILPKENWPAVDEAIKQGKQLLEFSFESGRVYLGVYNPNYVGSFVAIILPIILILLIFNKKKSNTIIYIATALALLLCLFGSQSRSGIISLAVSVALMIIIFRKTIIKYWKLSLISIIVIIIAFIGVDFSFNHVLSQRLFSAFSSNGDAKRPLENVQTFDDHVSVTYNGETLNVQFAVGDDGNISVALFDNDNNTIESSYNSDDFTFYISDEKFSSLSVTVVAFPDNVYGFSININGTPWYFSNYINDDGTYYYYNAFGKWTKINPVKSFAPLENHQEFASGRGYIWAKTIPLLKDNIIIGTGADTFSMAFPNEDYVGKINYGYGSALITKPHNIYLQIGVQTGVISLIAYLAFYIIYFISSLKLYFKSNFDDFMSQIGAAIFVGTLGYMISGIINDSSITVAPTYWVLMGIGLAINNIIKAQNE